MIYEEVSNVDGGPGDAGRAAEYGEDGDPSEEDDEDVGCPHAGVSKPLGVPIHVRRWGRLRVQLRHFYFLIFFLFPKLFLISSHPREDDNDWGLFSSRILFREHV